jgi:hypothetical protein
VTSSVRRLLRGKTPVSTPIQDQLTSPAPESFYTGLEMCTDIQGMVDICIFNALPMLINN